MPLIKKGSQELIILKPFVYMVCPGLDSNQHVLRHTPLKRACLPISPPGQGVWRREIRNSIQRREQDASLIFMTSSFFHVSLKYSTQSFNPIFCILGNIFHCLYIIHYAVDRTKNKRIPSVWPRLRRAHLSGDWLGYFSIKRELHPLFDSGSWGNNECIRTPNGRINWYYQALFTGWGFAWRYDFIRN